MADKQDEKREQPVAAPAPQVERIVVTESEDTRRSRALADAQAEAVRLQMDETVPGGRYKLGDRFVDANGKEVKD
jgi:hypothetical protein